MMVDIDAFIDSLSKEETHAALRFLARIGIMSCPRKQFPDYPCEVSDTCPGYPEEQGRNGCWLRYAVWKYGNARREAYIKNKSRKAFEAKLKELRDEFGPEVVDNLIEGYMRAKKQGEDKC